MLVGVWRSVVVSRGVWVGKLRFHSIFHKVVRPSPASLSLSFVMYFIFYISRTKESTRRRRRTHAHSAQTIESLDTKLQEIVSSRMWPFLLFSAFFFLAGCFVVCHIPFRLYSKRSKECSFPALREFFQNSINFFSFLLCSYQHHWQCRVRQHRAIFISIDRNLLPPRRRKVAFQLLLLLVELADFLPI